MDLSLDAAHEVLARTPETLRHLLGGLSPRWTDANEGADTWSPGEVLGHLIHGEETDWIPRATMILTKGEAQTFEPFDRFAQQERFAGWSVERLLQRFAALRAGNLSTLESWHLTPQQLALTGRHPELGRVTLAQLLACWVVHDLGHVAQIARVMAKQYTDAVGPWKAYLPVLTR